MSLWRLELLRLWRTRRWLVLAGTFGFFAVLGPVAARYLQEIVGQVGDVQLEVPDPTPIDGIAQYVNNVGQLGVLAVVIVTASALAFDRRVEAAAFYRTRLASVRRTVLPRWTVSTVAAVVAFVLGTAVAWGLTAALIGAPDPSATLLGAVLTSLYLVFVTAVSAVLASFTRGVLSGVFATVAVLLLLPALSLVSALEPWLPSELLGALFDVVAGRDATEFLRAAAVAAVAIPAMLAWSIARLDRREL